MEKSSHTNPPTILVFSEDRLILSAFEEFFKRERCKMISTVTLTEAGSSMDTSGFQLVVLDLPRLGPDERRFLMGCRTRHPSVPVMVVARDAVEVNREVLRRLGVETVLFKPFELDLVRLAVRHHLQLESTQS